MGNTDSKLNFRKAVIQLTTKTQPIEANDEAFWEQFWSDSVTSVQDVFTLIPAAEIRALREESPSNLATLCYKAVEKLVVAADCGCPSQRDQQTVLNCVRLLSRILPYIFEDPDWRGFFWSTLPGHADEHDNPPLAQSLLNAISDLLFCPDFTVASNRKSGPDNPEDMHSIDSCEYIWERGVGFAHSPAQSASHDQSRTELLKLLLTCFSETMYLPPIADAHHMPNQWILYFTSTENRHALPLFTSMLNVVCSYDPVGYGVPYNHLMFTDWREPLVEMSLQVLCITLENDWGGGGGGGGGVGSPSMSPSSAHPTPTSAPSSPASSVLDHSPDVGGPDNLFLNYLSRIHREEDFCFILKGLTRLLNNPLMQTYLPGSCKKVHFYQEMLVLFWKMCDINKKFMFYVLKSSDVLDVLVPILYFLNDARADQSRVGLMHIGVFILLLLSGERNFGVRLNKPYSVRVPMDIPVFTGTHADFLIIVFHKIITTGHQRLQPLFDCLLTIIVNVSPYLKTLSMVASTKLLHLLQAFSTPWFLYASPTNHHLVFFLLEVFNNIIQYQFDGNSNLVYTIIRKRNVFHVLANLPAEHSAIAKALSKRGKGLAHPTPDTKEPDTMEGATPATEAEPGTLKVSLAATPRLDKMTEKSAPDDGHSGQQQQQQQQHLQPQQQQQQQRRQHHHHLSNNNNNHNNNQQQQQQQLGASLHRQLTLKDLASGAKSPSPSSGDGAEEEDEDDDEKRRRMRRGRRLGRRGVDGDDDDDDDDDDDVDDDDDFGGRGGGGGVVSAVGIVASFPHSLTADALTSTVNLTTGSTNNNNNNSNTTATTTNQQHSHQHHHHQGSNNSSSGSGGVGESSGSHSTTAGNSAGKKNRGRTTTTTPTPTTPPTTATTTRLSSSSPQNATSTPNATATSGSSSSSSSWVATPDWVAGWKQKLPLQTMMRMLQVLVPQVEKICIDKGLKDETEILKFLQHGTLVGLLPVPHPILIRKYQANSGTTMWFRTYLWGVIYLRNVDPPIWYDTDVKLFEIQRV